MKKAIIALTAIFAVQIILLCCLGAPAKEIVKWSQNEYGDYGDYVFLINYVRVLVSVVEKNLHQLVPY